MELTLFQEGGLIALGQVLMIDIVLAGDNAVVIGLAAGAGAGGAAQEGHLVGPGRRGGAARRAWR